MEKTFANRLINARKIRCMSQRDLAESLKGVVTASAIAKYEKGEMMPSSNVMIHLSKALGLNMDYFFRPFSVAIDTSKFEFRKSSSLGKKVIESIKYSVCSDIEKYMEIESILESQVKFSLDYSNVTVESAEQAMAMAQRFREDMNIGSDAIVSAVELLESCGVKIIEIDQSNDFAGTCNTADTIPVIVINKNMSSERKRMTIFHELGHLLMKCASGVNEEKMCTVFANEVLIPSKKFTSIIGESRHDISLVELQAIQQEYGISIDALMAKAAQLNVITEQRYITYHKKKNKIELFKEAVERSRYQMEHTNRFERLVYRALASEIITYSKAAALLDISVNDVRENINLM